MHEFNVQVQGLGECRECSHSPILTEAQPIPLNYKLHCSFQTHGQGNRYENQWCYQLDGYCHSHYDQEYTIITHNQHRLPLANYLILTNLPEANNRGKNP